MARTARKKSKGISVNFKGVEGKLSAIPEGEYRAKVVSVTQEEGQAADYLKWEFELDGNEEHDGRKVYLNTSLAPQALWNLRGLLEALGVDVPDDEMDIDPTELEGLVIGLQIENESYEGKKRSKVSDYFTAAEDEPKKSSKKKSRDDEDEDEDEPKKPMTRAEKRRAAKAKAVEEEDDDEEDEKPTRKSRRSRDEDDDDDKPARSKRRSRRDEDEEEEDEKPSKKSSKKKAAAVSEDDVNDMSEEELEELVEEHELDIDIQKARTLTKKRNLVIDGLTEAGVL